MSTRFTSGPASFTSGPTKGAIPSRTTSPIRGASPAPPASNSRGRDTKSPAAVRTPSASKKEVDTPVKGARAKTPTQLPEPKDDQELEKVKAWQSEVDLLEQQQMKIQQDQMNLLHNQIHILTRELGDLQNKFMYFQTDLQAAQEEAHSALRLELAEHGNNAAEMKAAWEEAHNALKDAMDDGLSDLAEKHAQALEDHKAEHAKALGDLGGGSGNSLADMEAIHNQRYEEHTASLEQGLEGVHSTLQKELAELRSGHAVNLQAVVTDVTDQVDKLTKDVEQMAEDLKAAQEEAHSALRLELAEHGNNAEEMRAAWEEAHQALSSAMDSGLSSLAEQHARALDDHAAAHGANLADMEGKLQRDLQSLAEDHAGHLTALNDEHHAKHAQNSADLENGLQSALDTAHGRLQDELNQLRHGGAGSLTEMSKILADVTEQVDNLDQALEKEHELRMAVEVKLDQMCSELRSDLQVSFQEAHSALRLELAEHGGKAEDIKAAMEEAHAALKGELQQSHSQLWDELSTHKDTLDEKNSAMNDLLNSMNDEHHEKHAQNAEALENGLQNALDSAHGKLQDELNVLRHGGAGSLKEMSKILADVTQQVDNLDQALAKEHELRMAVETKLDEMCDALKRELELTFKEAHSALKLELAEHGGKADDIKAAMEEANQAMQDELKASQAAMKGELDSHKKSFEIKHRGIEDAMKTMDDTHHEKHAQNAEKIEATIDNVLGGAHAKLQEEMKLLKSGGAGSLKDLSKVLADVTQQVDKIDQAVESEHQLRMAVEEKLDQMFNDQDKAIQDVRNDLKVALKESHAALKLELAEHGKSKDDIQAAMEDAHEALREEMRLSSSAFKKDIDNHVKNNDAKHKDMASAMKAMNDEHHEKHAQNAEKLEESINNVLGGAHAKLQDEIKMLKTGGAGSLKDLSKIVADVTQQVDNIDQAVQKEHELRLAVEDKLDQMFNDQDKATKDLRKDLQVALKESHAALKLELADHGKSKDDIKAAMEEAHAALQEETKLSHAALKDEIASHVKKNDAKHKSSEDAMKKMNEEHHEKHAQNSEKLEASINNVLGGAHAKLQDELKMLKSGGAGSLKDLSKILADVTQQVDNIDQAVQKEHELRMAVETRLDDMFNDQDKAIQGVRKDLSVALKESHAALKLELAEHSKSKEDMRTAMMEAHGALKEEMALHGKTSGSAMATLEAQLRKDLKKVADDQDDIVQRGMYSTNGDVPVHAQNASSVEAGLHNVLASTHRKLQQDLSALQSGADVNNASLREILSDVTKQVDALSIAIDREHDLRMAVEAKLDKMFADVKQECDIALKESHAAIRVEMAMQSKDANEMKAAMAEAHQALKSEAGLSHGAMHGKLEEHGRAHKASLTDLEQQLRADLARVEQRVQLHETASHDKHNQAFRELQSAGTKITELQNTVSGHRSKMDLSQNSLDDRLAYIERQLKERVNAAKVTEGKLLKYETMMVELADKHNKEMEALHGRFRECLMKLEQARGLNDNHQAMMEQRLSGLDRAMLETSDQHAKALSAFHAEYGKEMAHILHAERVAREQQEKTFLDYIQDARQQKEALEATLQEQVRLERVAREVQTNQLRDAMTHQVHWGGNAEYTDILLQERSSREATERTLERRIEAFERAISMERNERAQDLQRIWDAFDGHTHEAMSPLVQQVQARSVPTSVMHSPRAIMSPRPIHTAPVVEEIVQVQERVIPTAVTPMTPPTLSTTVLPQRVATSNGRYSLK